MKITLINHGLKKGPLPPGADLYLDARALPDPAMEKDVSNNSISISQAYKNRTGKEVYTQYLPMVADMVMSLPHRRKNSTTKVATEATVCCFCAYGIHRSVALKHILFDAVQKYYPSWQVVVK